LREFFESARVCLHEEGEIWVTLKGGQGGSKAELPGFAREYSNTWQVQEQAGLSGLVLASVSEANIDRLEEAGYRSVGFRGSDRSFFTKGSLTHIFTFPEQVKHVFPTSSSSSSEHDGLIAHPLVYRRDICFWVDESEDYEADFVNLLKSILQPLSISFTIENFDSYLCPKENRISKGYHVDLWSDTQPLSKARVKEILSCVDKSLFEKGAIEFRKVSA
jgi:hypothetical protein